MSCVKLVAADSRLTLDTVGVLCRSKPFTGLAVRASLFLRISNQCAVAYRGAAGFINNCRDTCDRVVKLLFSLQKEHTPCALNWFWPTPIL